ncbi:hypothetical protein [Herbiconiux sp.]|uniref:hypothetical protein n=1 Tax=Herbiconiux sp. TaxID=1871186 RepID=UPI0025BB7D52|nr:hypothetical protein [Herbiconiux sp.]
MVTEEREKWVMPYGCWTCGHEFCVVDDARNASCPKCNARCRAFQMAPWFGFSFPTSVPAVMNLGYVQDVSIYNMNFYDAPVAVQVAGGNIRMSNVRFERTGIGLDATGPTRVDASDIDFNLGE